MLVRGKGDKERVVPLGRSAQEALSEYLKLGRPDLAAGKRRGAVSMNNSPLLFIASGGRKVTRQRIWQMVRAASAGSGRAASPHMLRHSCATHMVENAPICARCRPSWAMRIFRDASLHAFGAGSLENGVSEASSPGEGKMKSHG